MNNLKKHIVHGLLMSALLMSGGCIMDSYDQPDYSQDEASTIGYMSVKLMADDGATRAQVGDSYEQGVNAEYMLSDEANHFAIFYTDGEDLPIAVATLEAMTSEINPDSEANTSVVFATIAARDERKEALQLLNDCYVFLNSELSEADLWNKTPEELMKITESSPFFTSSNGTRYFKMANSVYVENGRKKIHTEVDSSKIFGSYQEAMEEAWKGNAAVNAYVERLAAKFQLSFEKEEYNQPYADRVFVPENNKMVVYTGLDLGNIPLYTDGNSQGKYNYKIRITGWGINAIEKESYLFRNFNPQTPYFTGWTNTANKRVYWSEDRNYNKATYPWQYRKVIDNSGIPVYENGDNILVNFSYEQLNANKFIHTYAYSPENTYDFADASFMSSLNNHPHIVAGTHMVVCGELLTNVGDDINTYHTNDIFRDRNGNFYLSEKDCFKALVTVMNNILESHAFLKFTYWDWSKGGVETKLFVRTEGSYYIYYNGKKLTPDKIDELYRDLPEGEYITTQAEFKGSDGKRIIWPVDGFTIQDDNGNKLWTYSYIDEADHTKDIPLREATVNDLKSVIFEHIGAIDHFKDGKMYYSIPIGLIENADNDKKDSTDYSVYGVVRNTSYHVEIKDVLSIGSSVDNENQPIVGAQRSTSDQLHIGFKIIDWHPIDQTVPGLIN